MRLKLYLLQALIYLICLAPEIGSAWTYTGHVIIAQIAYHQLTPKKKAKVDQLAQSILVQLPEKEQAKLDRYYPNASSFAKAAILSDIWRNLRLATLFRKFDAVLPMNLSQASNQTTASWHYYNQAYPPSSTCQTLKPLNAIWALNKIEADLSANQNLNSQALLMILMEHYIADLHQPLHGITHVADDCQDDRGGNDFCIKINKAGKCSQSLHTLWDKGVGYIRPHENIQNRAYELSADYPESSLKQQIADAKPDHWAKEDYLLADFIYHLSKHQKPSQEYYRRGQSIAKERLVLAGYRLAQALSKNL